MRILVISTFGAALAAFALGRGVGPGADALGQAAGVLRTALPASSLARAASEPDAARAGRAARPGVAAFVEVEGTVFRILVGRDSQGETWSAAVGER